MIANAQSSFTLGDAWGVQVADVAAKSDWQTYKKRMELEFYAITYSNNARIAKIQLNGELIDQSDLRPSQTSFLLRNRATEVIVRNNDSNFYASLIDMVDKGYEPTNGQALLVHSESLMALHELRNSIGVETVNNVDVIFSEPAYLGNTVNLLSQMIEFRRLTDGKKRTLVASDKRIDFSFDPCWYPATKDEKTDQMSVEHLLESMACGKSARIFMNPEKKNSHVTLKMKVAYITKDFVVFQMYGFQNPKFGGDNDESIKEVLLSTRGDTLFVNRGVTASKVTKLKKNIASVSWFVDSRAWEKAYETTLDGSWVHGDLNQITTLAKSGSDFHILVNLTSMTIAFKPTVVYVPLDLVGVSAEVSNVVAVDVTANGFDLTRQDVCELKNYMVSTDSGLRSLTYTIGSGGESAEDDWSTYTGTISWFVQT